MKRLCAGIAAVTMGAVLAGGTPVPAAAAAGGIDWGACADLKPRGDAKPECAELTVPMDTGAGGRERADTPAVTLALSRVPARVKREGTLLVNPGGPGSPGRDWAAATADGLPADLRDRFDVVGFDPRGTGASTPAIHCDPGYYTPVRPDGIPHSTAEAAVLVSRATSYADTCAERNGPLLDHMGTLDSVSDMESIRTALGAERIDYLGYSYGTYLGAAYATQYPDRIRRLVLDSIVDPRRPWYESNLAQNRSLEAAAQNFFGWAARNDATYALGGSAGEVEKHYYSVRERLAEAPVDDALGPVEYESTYILAAYASDTWPVLARALADYAVRDDPAALKAAHKRFGENADSDPGHGAYLATQCTDAQWPHDWPTWRRDAEQSHAEAPFQSWSNTWYNAPCMAWAGDSRPWFEVGGQPAGGALLVQATDDGPTPVGGAYAMRDRFTGSRLIVEDGGVDHGVALNGNACVDGAVAAYLRDGTLPAPGGGADGADRTCAAAPQPDPEPAEPQREPLRHRHGPHATR
ncbi:alpha/beta hydrolase family protein [Murinocardiopsis flavida]|uniref:Alpha/beta hydrolase family protein n=1 Tax=Murinocardiopsis flavida TaxID=645275 RepID=A0A2P8CW02_9ACTN|nr:alpha/beta hydrolase [Murinocardiopsis flavida]PSK89163.1 alpha/beta hydrolase family protein [Murinocardiopsis flavida]